MLIVKAERVNIFHMEDWCAYSWQDYFSKHTMTHYNRNGHQMHGGGGAMHFRDDCMDFESPLFWFIAIEKHLTRYSITFYDNGEQLMNFPILLKLYNLVVRDRLMWIISLNFSTP